MTTPQTVTLYTETPSRNRPDLTEQVKHVESVGWRIGVGVGCFFLLVQILKGMLNWQTMILFALLVMGLALIIGGVFTWHVTIVSAGLVVTQEETTTYAAPREIPTNRGELTIRPDTLVTVGDMTLDKATMDAMERLFSARVSTGHGHISRDEIGWNGRNDDYNRLVYTLQRLEYLTQDKRYTGRGVEWLKRESYYPPPPADSGA